MRLARATLTGRRSRRLGRNERVTLRTLSGRLPLCRSRKDNAQFNPLRYLPPQSYDPMLAGSAQHPSMPLR